MKKPLHFHGLMKVHTQLQKWTITQGVNSCVYLTQWQTCCSRSRNSPFC